MKPEGRLSAEEGGKREKKIGLGKMIGRSFAATPGERCSR
jgi:hypothetical protein